MGVVDKPQAGEGKDVYFKFQLQSHQGIHFLAMKFVNKLCYHGTLLIKVEWNLSIMVTHAWANGQWL